MTLSDLFGVIENANAVVTVKDYDNTELVKFYLSGSSQLLTDLLAREVDGLSIKNQNEMTVTLKEGI
jgi:hypothetical protein